MAEPRARKYGLLTLGIATAALLGTAAVASPATAADGDIIGEATVTLDFTVAGSVSVAVNTTNLSTVPAVGTATVTAPDGTVHNFGPRSYQAGESWTYAEALEGYTCADLSWATAVAFGSASVDGPVEWTSGLVTYPDPRVTVIGCDPAPPVDPEPPVVPGVPPTEPVQPGTAPVVNTLPVSKTDGALVATNDIEPVFLPAAALLLVVGSGLAVALRRRQATR